MAVSEAQFEKIARYLNDELPLEEEAVFVRELAADKELQKAFDIELLLRQQTPIETESKDFTEDEIEFEPAGEHLKKVKNILETGVNKPDKNLKGGREIRMFGTNTQRLIAAAAVLVIIAFIFLYNYRNRASDFVTHNTVTEKPDSSTNKHFSDNKSHEETSEEQKILADNRNLEKIANKFYKPYAGSYEDAAEVSYYLELYKNKKYTEVLNATEDDYETKGFTDNKTEKLLEYNLLFYKALSYLETGRSSNAIDILNKIIRQHKIKDNLYYQSEWYLLLGCMRTNNAKKSEELLNLILNNKNNPYRTEALQIFKLMNAT